MSEKRQATIHTGPVGGHLYVRNQPEGQGLIDLSGIPIFISFSRDWRKAGDVLYPATITGARTDSINRVSECYATVQVGPEGVVQLSGRWFGHAHVVGLEDGSEPVVLTGAYVFY